MFNGSILGGGISSPTYHSVEVVGARETGIFGSLIKRDLGDWEDAKA